MLTAPGSGPTRRTQDRGGTEPGLGDEPERLSAVSHDRSRHAMRLDGGSPITGYVVTAYIGYGPAKMRIFNSTSTTQTVTGLTNGITYRFRVRAYNAYGISGFSTVTNAVTPTP